MLVCHQVGKQELRDLVNRDDVGKVDGDGRHRRTLVRQGPFAIASPALLGTRVIRGKRFVSASLADMDADME